MRIRIFFFCLLFIITSCGGQNRMQESSNKDENIQQELKNNQYLPKMEPNNEKMIIKKFDIKAFNANNKYGTYEFTTTEGIVVVQYEILDPNSDKVDGYYENRKYMNSPYEYYNEYNANGHLILNSTSFYSINTGISKEYDSLGNVIKEEDFDKDYPFSIDMLIDKMMKEYNIDIVSSTDGNRVSRGIFKDYHNMPLYQLWIKTEPESERLNCYLINGNTGETLYTTIRYPDDKRGSLFDNYMDSLKEENAKANDSSLKEI